MHTETLLHASQTSCWDSLEPFCAILPRVYQEDSSCIGLINQCRTSSLLRLYPLETTLGPLQISLLKSALMVSLLKTWSSEVPGVTVVDRDCLPRTISRLGPRASVVQLNIQLPDFTSRTARDIRARVTNPSP